MSDRRELEEIISALANLRDTALEVTQEMVPDVASNPLMVVEHARRELLELRKMREAKARTAPINWCDECTDYVAMKIVEQGEGVLKDYICTCPICNTTTIA